MIPLELFIVLPFAILFFDYYLWRQERTWNKSFIEFLLLVAYNPTRYGWRGILGVSCLCLFMKVGLDYEFITLWSAPDLMVRF
ncbi:MAG: hypothetical protein AAGE89_04715 [Pseudomonadota bacterium]